MAAAMRAQELMTLARSRTSGDRDRLLLAVADLCASAADAAPAPAQGLLDDVFLTLVADAERDIRRALAEKLARAAWAPKALINRLARDEIEIARPVILSSPLLQDQDLLALLLETAVEHQIEVARRPRLAARVVDAILDKGEPAVLTALVANPTAEISEAALGRLVTASRRVAALRPPLVRHPRLTRAMAEQLYAWVGEALKGAIADRFEVDGRALDRAVAAAVRSARPGQTTFVSARTDADREDMERRLVTKLAAAGDLRPGFLLRALKERRLVLFQVALAQLGGFAVEEIRRACTATDPELLALACAAVAIDRGVFPSLLLGVRELNTARPGGGGDAVRRAMGVFARRPEEARRRFRELSRGV